MFPFIPHFQQAKTSNPGEINKPYWEDIKVASFSCYNDVMQSYGLITRAIITLHVQGGMILIAPAFTCKPIEICSISLVQLAANMTPLVSIPIIYFWVDSVRIHFNSRSVMIYILKLSQCTNYLFLHNLHVKSLY